jgi:Rrf2 family protein
MLTLTRKTEYALIALTHLARVNGEVVSARDLADKHAMPQPLLMNILKQLQRGGMIESVRGARGGYRMHVSPAEISLARLIETLEGPFRLVRCAEPDDGESVEGCELSGGCPIKSPAARIHERLKDFLDNVSLAEIAHDDSTANEPGTHRLTLRGCS